MNELNFTEILNLAEKIKQEDRSAGLALEPYIPAILELLYDCEGVFVNRVWSDLCCSHNPHVPDECTCCSAKNMMDRFEQPFKAKW